jgi:phage replication O-like protein O
MKITPPNYTQTPNDLFDKWLPHLGEAELKVLLVIMRKTFGWHKIRDFISISQLASITGMLEETVVKAAKSLQIKGVIKRIVVGQKGKQQTIYELNIEENSNKSYPSVEPRGELSTPLGLDPLGSTEAQKKASLNKCSDVSWGGAEPAIEKEKEKEIKVRGPRNSMTILTHEGVKNTAALKQHNWQDDEIDYALEIIANHKEPISNWLSFIGAVIKNLRMDKNKQQTQKGRSCNNQKIKLPPTEPGIRTHNGESMSTGTYNSILATRQNHFQEFCSPETYKNNLSTG